MHNSKSLQLDSNNNKKWFRKKSTEGACLHRCDEWTMPSWESKSSLGWSRARAVQQCTGAGLHPPCNSAFGDTETSPRGNTYIMKMLEKLLSNGQMLQWGLPPILTRERAGQHLPLYHWGYTKRAPQKCTQGMLVTQNPMRGRLAGSAHSAWDFQCQDPEFKPYTGQGAYLKKKKNQMLCHIYH